MSDIQDLIHTSCLFYRFYRVLRLPEVSTMFLVGLTGGIATGKSTVSGMMQELGVPVVDADLIARQSKDISRAFFYLGSI